MLVPLVLLRFPQPFPLRPEGTVTFLFLSKSSLDFAWKLHLATRTYWNMVRQACGLWWKETGWRTVKKAGVHLLFVPFYSLLFEFLWTNEIKKKQNLISVICSRDLPSVCANKVSVVRHRMYWTSSFNTNFSVISRICAWHPELGFFSPSSLQRNKSSFPSWAAG
jgi:hypothetical protein